MKKGRKERKDGMAKNITSHTRNVVQQVTIEAKNDRVYPMDLSPRSI